MRSTHMSQRPNGLHALHRRQFLKAAAAAAVAASTTALPWRIGRGQPAQPLAATSPSGALMRFPEKLPLILHTDRPPNLETPISYSQHDLTPNDAFYVRWHLGITPTRVDTAEF